MSIKEELTKKWRACGIRNGDIVLLHSDVTRLYLHYKRLDKTFTVGDILDSFVDAVGEGNLILPTFNFNFSDGVGTYDIRYTPSQMGALTECARRRWGRCNGHPVYSFAQSRKDRFVDNYQAFSIDSPFAEVLLEAGKVAVLGKEENGSMTFYHYVEAFWKAPWRYSKQFTGDYIDGAGKISKKTYEMYVRYLNYQTNNTAMGEILWGKGIWRGERPNIGHGLRVAKAEEIYQEVTRVILNHEAENILYKKLDDSPVSAL